MRESFYYSQYEEERKESYSFVNKMSIYWFVTPIFVIFTFMGYLFLKKNIFYFLSTPSDTPMVVEKIAEPIGMSQEELTLVANRVVQKMEQKKQERANDLQSIMTVFDKINIELNEESIK